MAKFEVKNLHLTEPFRIAHGACSTRDVVRVHDEGAVGEAPFVFYYNEQPQETLDWLEGGCEGPGTRAGKLALDLCRWDKSPIPLWQVAEKTLGPGRPWGEVYVCRSLGIPTDLETFRDKVKETAKQFRVLKLKLGSGNLEHDEAIVATARTAAPDTEIFADVNGGWSVEDTVVMMDRLRPYNLALLEQPLHHQHGLEPWIELKSRAPTNALPLYADESAHNADDVRRLAEAGVVQGVNMKLLKCTSFERGVDMIATARKLGLGVLLGCMIESSLGTTAAAHLAPWADYVDLDGHLYLSDDDYLGVTFDELGRLQMPTKPGIGASPRSKQD